MNKQRVRDLVYDGLTKVVSGMGFQLEKSKEGFTRPFHGGKQTLGVPLYDYNPEFEFSLTICTRLDTVEDIFHLFSGATPKYRGGTYTVITDLEYFTRSGLLFEVTTEDDIREAVNQLLPVIRDSIIPFLDCHRDVESLNKLVNHGVRPVDKSHHPARGMHGVILAHLADDPDFEMIASKYQEEVSLLPAGEQEKFRKLIQHLRLSCDK